jgi:hypothetical protein
MLNKQHGGVITRNRGNCGEFGEAEIDISGIGNRVEMHDWGRTNPESKSMDRKIEKQTGTERTGERLGANRNMSEAYHIVRRYSESLHTSEEIGRRPNNPARENRGRNITTERRLDMGRSGEDLGIHERVDESKMSPHYYGITTPTARTGGERSEGIETAYSKGILGQNDA